MNARSTAAISSATHLPARRFAAVRVVRYEDTWLVLAGEHGWLHGDRGDALADAQWI